MRAGVPNEQFLSDCHNVPKSMHEIVAEDPRAQAKFFLLKTELPYRFIMGIEKADSRDSLAQQAVEVREFFLDKTAVTNEAFRAFRKETSFLTDSDHRLITKSVLYCLSV